MSLNNFSIQPETYWFYFLPSTDCQCNESKLSAFLKQALSVNSDYLFNKGTIGENVSRACVALYHGDKYLIGTGMLYPEKLSSGSSITYCNSNSVANIQGLARLAIALNEKKADSVQVRIIYALKQSAFHLEEFQQHDALHSFLDVQSLRDPMSKPSFRGVESTLTSSQWSFFQVIKICCPEILFEDEHFLLSLSEYIILSNVLITLRCGSQIKVKDFCSLANLHSLTSPMNPDDSYVQILLIAPQNVDIFQEGCSLEKLHDTWENKLFETEYITVESDVIDTWGTLEVLSNSGETQPTLPCADGPPRFFHCLPKMLTNLQGNNRWHLNNDTIVFNDLRLKYGAPKPKPETCKKPEKKVSATESSEVIYFGRKVKRDTSKDILGAMRCLNKTGVDPYSVYPSCFEVEQNVEDLTQEDSDSSSDSSVDPPVAKKKRSRKKGLTKHEKLVLKDLSENSDSEHEDQPTRKKTMVEELIMVTPKTQITKRVTRKRTSKKKATTPKRGKKKTDIPSAMWAGETSDSTATPNVVAPGIDSSVQKPSRKKSGSRMQTRSRKA